MASTNQAQDENMCTTKAPGDRTAALEGSILQLSRGDALGVLIRCEAALDWCVCITHLRHVTTAPAYDNLGMGFDSTPFSVVVVKTDELSSLAPDAAANSSTSGLYDSAALRHMVQEITAAEGSATVHDWARDAHLEISRERCRYLTAPVAGYVALHVACVCGSLGVVRELLALTGDRTVDVHAENEWAFAAACAMGHIAVVRELLALAGERTVDVHACAEQAFSSACEGGHIAVVRELLALTGDRAINVHAGGGRGFHTACSKGHVAVVRALLSLTGDRAMGLGSQGRDALRAACANGHLEVVRELLALTGDRTVDVHEDDEACFYEACANGHVAVVRELLALTGDRAVDLQYCDTGDESFKTACVNGHVAVARELLALTGVRAVNMHVEDDYALCAACAGGHLGVLQELLRADWFNKLHDTRRLPSLQPRHSPLTTALQRCVPTRQQHPALAQQVAQQVLMHILRGTSSATDNTTTPECSMTAAGALQQYCSLVAALPAAECAPLRQAIQECTAPTKRDASRDESFESSSLMVILCGVVCMFAISPWACRGESVPLLHACGVLWCVVGGGTWCCTGMQPAHK